MIVAQRMLRDHRSAMIGWTIALIGVAIFVTALFPSVEGQTGLEETFRQLPAAVRAMVGAGEGISIISATGFLHGRLFAAFAPLLFIIFGIGLGARTIGGDEQAGTLELLLANPVTRERLAAERVVVLLALMLWLGLVLFGSVALLAQVIGGSLAAIAMTSLLEATAGSVLIALVFATLAFAVGAITGSRGRAVTVATVAAVATYLLHVLTATIPSLSWLGAMSPWRWYLDQVALVHGLAPAAIALPLAASTVFTAGGMMRFLRRDLR